MGNICQKRNKAVEVKTLTVKKPVARSAPGRLVNSYKIQSVIGKGSFGIVRKALSLSDRSMPVAIKSINKKLVDEPDLLAVELDIIRRVDHPNIVKYYEYFEDSKYLHIVMEHCSGGELFDRIIRKSSLSEREAAMYMEKILLAVNHLHEINICHRDLKPQNFLFENASEDAELKLIDFGLSNRLEGGYGKQGVMNEIVGTPYYVAPEVINGRYRISCDLWSCGIILYVMLTGKPPFIGNTEEALYASIMKGKINTKSPKWKSMSPMAKDLINKLLNKLPEQRLTASQALQHAWFQSSESEPLVIDSAVLSSISEFNVSNKMKGIALGIMVKILEIDQIKEIRDIFYGLDTSNTGYLSVEEVTEGLAKYFPEKDAKKLFQNMDYNRDGKINYSEFLAVCLSSKIENDEQLVWNAFQLIDHDSSGYITTGNMKNVFNKLGYKRNPTLIKNIIEEVDLSKDGKISFEEFKHIFDKMQ